MDKISTDNSYLVPWPPAQPPGAVAGGTTGMQAIHPPPPSLPSLPLVPLLLLQLPPVPDPAALLQAWPIEPVCTFRPLLEHAYPAGLEPNAHIVMRFNRGDVSAEHVLKVTSTCMRECNLDWNTAMTCLEALARCYRQDAVTGRWETVSPDAISYFLAMTSAERARRADKVLALFQHLLERGPYFPVPVFPNTRLYNTVMSVCERAGMCGEALALFGQLVRHGPLLPTAVFPDIYSYNTAFSIFRRHEQLGCYVPLLHDGITAGIFRPSLGLDIERKRLDLRQQAVLVEAGADGDYAVHPVIARALFLTLFLTPGRVGLAPGIDQATEFVFSQHSSSAVRRAIADCMCEQGWHPLYRVEPAAAGERGRLGVLSATGPALNPLAEPWEEAKAAAARAE